MPRKTPTVVDGPRDASARNGAMPEQEVQSIAKLKAAIPAAKNGEVIYQSQYGRYRVQLTAPMDRIDPATGVVTRFRPLVAQFQDYEYRTKDANIIALLESKKAYGLDKDYWRAEDEQKRHVDNVTEALSQTVRAQADPEVAARLIRELLPLAGPDFQLPGLPAKE